jgi:hypothetical protein
MITNKSIIAVRRGSSAAWVNANPLLVLGEIGYDTTALKFKVGNGEDLWNDLPYVTAGDTQALWTRTDPTTITVGGITSGTSGSALVGDNAIEILERMLYPYVAPVFSNLSVSGLSSAYEIGQPFITSGTATWTAGQPTANWINGTGYISFTPPTGVVGDIAGPFNPTSQSQVLNFSSFTAPTSPVNSNSITIALRGQHNAANPTNASTSISRQWWSRMYFGKSSNANLTTNTFNVAAGTNNGALLQTTNGQGPSNYSMDVGAGGGYFYFFIHNDYTLSTAGPFFGLRFGTNALAQDPITTVTLTNQYGVTATYKRYKSTNILNDAITVVANPTS